MNVKCCPLGNIAANCYILSTEKAVCVVDPGAYSAEIKKYLEDNSDKERLIVLTHGHFDHIGGAEQLRKETGVKIAIGEKDAGNLSNSTLNLSEIFGVSLNPFTADRKLKDGENLAVGDIDFKVIETPGHTEGGICLYTDGILISGDTLFEGSVGRTDFPGGNTNQIMDSLEKLMKLDGKTRVLPGHGRETTIDKERKYNPYVKGLI